MSKNMESMPMGKQFKKHCNRPTERVAVFTNYGTHEHVECVTVVIQQGGFKSGGKVLDYKRFWSRDYSSPHELREAAASWAVVRGASRVAQIDDVFPLEECKDVSVRVLD